MDPTSCVSSEFLRMRPGRAPVFFFIIPVCWPTLPTVRNGLAAASLSCEESTLRPIRKSRLVARFTAVPAAFAVGQTGRRGQTRRETEAMGTIAGTNAEVMSGVVTTGSISSTGARVEVAP